MKKILLIIISVILSLSFTACQAAGIIYEFDSEKPWGHINAYEKCDYKVELIERKTENKTTYDARVFAKGNFSFILEQKKEGMTEVIELSSNFELTYENEDFNGADKGLTDTIVSKVKFTKDGCSPILSEKTVTLAPRKNSDGQYIDTDSYNAYANYNDKTATLSSGKAVDQSGATASDYKEVTSYALKTDDNNFDNEQMFYIIRALTKTSPEGAYSLTISNVFETVPVLDKKGKYTNLGVNVSVSKEYTVFNLDEAFAKDYLTASENGDYPVNCMKTLITKNDKLPGPSLVLYLSEPGTKFTNSNNSVSTSKVIVSMRTAQYDINNLTESFNLVYTLNNYSTSRPA